jgi:CheY-like chemotaxis protein
MGFVASHQKDEMPSPAHALNVLIIDDNFDAADMLCQLIRTFGHQATFCTCGQDGIAAAKALKPNLILLDIGMPLMDGFEVACELRKCRSLDESKIVAVTAWGDAITREKAAACGFDAHITKPVSFERLQREFPN